MSSTTTYIVLCSQESKAGMWDKIGCLYRPVAFH